MGYFNGVIIRYVLLKPFLSDASIFVLAYFYGLTGKKKALINRAMYAIYVLLNEREEIV
ncbi:TPA_asm: hypothetical protein GND82_002017 [Salmonella enterica subsp. salamae serovar 60:g,m,t:z6]|uniref:Uncharacterized protein n=1 Tax=Salmonella enterica subsp. houtenae serovar 1,40:z4,z32:- TaxID=1967604 RepID=A0A730ZHM2_SALHO|nr:hypothetical protein [Salmonella enterica subsp. enterica serovar 1,9,12:-:-]HAE4189490.1 hypothetical protein [Salmonella enterica subsp. houtenae serovar 1,40:z4,z32:-]HAE7513171.1 hypothetical protein [Salmonella enterica subsp. salamae serovar 60:g,m,t:z6]